MTIVVMNPYAYRNMPDKYLIYQMNLQSRDKTDTKFEILIQFYFHFFMLFLLFFFLPFLLLTFFMNLSAPSNWMLNRANN